MTLITRLSASQNRSRGNAVELTEQNNSRIAMDSPDVTTITEHWSPLCHVHRFVQRRTEVIRDA